MHKENYKKNHSHTNEAYEEHDDKVEISSKPSTKPKENQINITTTELSKENKKIKWSILKNVVAISFSFSLLYTSFFSMSNLQSSLHRQMGTTSLGMNYLGNVLSCLFLPTILIKHFGPKWTLILSTLLFVPYLAAMSIPTYYTFLPTGLLMGLAGAPLWASKCAYLTRIGIKYGELVGESSSVVLSKFFGIFFLFFQSSQVWGNLLSSAVLSIGVQNFTRSEEFLEKCGINLCPAFKLNSSLTSSNSTEVETIMPDVDESKIHIMTGIYLAFGLGAALFLILVVDPLSRFGIEKNDDKGKDRSVKSLLLASFSQMKTANQLHIIPLTMFSGIDQGFLSADYTSGFVTCYLGVHMVGYVLICFGVSDAICSLGVASLIKLFNRVPVFTLGAIINGILLTLLFTWKPDPNQPVVFFIVSTIWGMADAVWQTQINALYGIIFPGKSEAAFSNYRLWKSVGFIIAYSVSGSLCMDAKLSILIVFLCIGMSGYYVIEGLEKRKLTK